MSCIIVDGVDGRLLGPVDAKGAISVLAPQLAEARPKEFPTVKDAENHLMFIHFRNMSQHTDSSGGDYPKKI